MKPQLLKIIYPLILGASIFLLLLVCFSGCNTQKRIAKICATCPTKTIIKDSVRVEIKERKVNVFFTDTFIYFLPNPCAKLCDSNGNLKPTFTHTIVSDKGTIQTLSVKNNSLVLIEQLDSLKKVISVKDTLIERFVNTTIEVPSQCKLEHLTWWDKFFKGLGQILSLIVLSFLGYKIVKYYIKFHKPL
jgi:hypothetical protein